MRPSRAASDYSFGSQDESLSETESLESLYAILRASRHEPAARRKERRYQSLIEHDQPNCQH